jgi:hypothetical protein
MILRDETIQKITGQWARETEKEDRKLIRKQAIGKYYRKGWVAGIVWAAGFMTRKGRSDIARAIMNEALLDREQCREAGLSDFDLQGIKSRVVQKLQFLNKFRLKQQNAEHFA